MASICCSPPESVPACWRNRSRSRRRNARTSARSPAPPPPDHSGYTPKPEVLLHRQLKGNAAAIHLHARRRAAMSSVALPSMRSSPSRISPEVRTMQIARSVVVLPAPLAPSSAVTPPPPPQNRCRAARASRHAACSPRASSSAGMLLLVRLTQICPDHFWFVTHLIRCPIGNLQPELQRHHLVRYPITRFM